jgi:2-methylaconitate cis-trans-isomerase PrpF
MTSTSAPPSIPCVLMRAGTSRGPFFLKDWLPNDLAERDQVLVRAIGSMDTTQIGGLGGGTTLTSKVAIVSPSTRADCEVDYLFAQLSPHNQLVDTKPNCGNMLAGVAPFAIEQGLVPTQGDVTTVKVHNVNTGARIDVTVCTPAGRVQYSGSAKDVKIDGVNDAASPVLLTFTDAWGAMDASPTEREAAIFPTGHRSEIIDGIECTCIVAGQTMVLMRACDVAREFPNSGLQGNESAAELDAIPGLIERLEKIRRLAGLRMGLGDVSNSVVPKPVLVSPHQTESPGCLGGHQTIGIVSRYFTPKKCHTSHAVTGAIGVATALAMRGTVASSPSSLLGILDVQVYHPSGVIHIAAHVAPADAFHPEPFLTHAAVVRTVRKIMEGHLHY